MKIEPQTSKEKPKYPLLSAAAAGVASLLLCACPQNKQRIGGSVPNDRPPMPPQQLGGAVAPGSGAERHIPVPEKPEGKEEEPQRTGGVIPTPVPPEEPQLLGGDVPAPSDEDDKL